LLDSHEYKEEAILYLQHKNATQFAGKLRQKYHFIKGIHVPQKSNQRNKKHFSGAFSKL